MILQALSRYYQRLERDPDSDIAPYGFSRQKISFCIVLNPDGSLHEIADARSQDGKKLVPLSLVVPGNSKPSGSGINPCFLWDNAAYMLGYKPGDEKLERTRESFEAFRAQHIEAESAISDPEFSSVCAFLKRWNPDDAVKHPVLVNLGTGFGAFRMRGAQEYVHERPAIREWWLSRINSVASDSRRLEGQCLVTGEQATIARLHEPKIKGVWGGQSSGATLVSFNFDATESYGKNQSINAPVSERAAFQYCTALNRLLASPDQRIQIGDATTVFWTEQPSPAETMLPWVFEPNRAEDDALKNQLHSILARIKDGQYPGEFGDPQTPFYVLGLSPNAARISVRFWWVSTLGTLIDNLRQHFADLEMFDPSDLWVRQDSETDDSTIRSNYRTSHPQPQRSPPGVRRLLDETVPAKSGHADREKISPQLAGSLMRAILHEGQYPRLLFQRVLMRIQTDGFSDSDKRLDWKQSRHRRASIIRACLNREFRQQYHQQENSVDSYLNKLHPHAAYQCGRLMAVVAFIQEMAIKKVNATVVRRFLSAVSVSPGLHLGRLQVQAEVGHLHKLPPKTASFLRDEMKLINARIQDQMPSRFNQIGQGLFVLGFYHELTHLEADRPTLKHRVRTIRGEWVMSNGEKAVADVMAKMGINYVYEAKVVLVEGINRIPDFMIPATNESHQRYIEYLGVSNSEEYDNRWSDKLLAYHNSGITEEGGNRGRLYVIDARSEEWDQGRLASQLTTWFGNVGR